MLTRFITLNFKSHLDDLEGFFLEGFLRNLLTNNNKALDQGIYQDELSRERKEKKNKIN